MMPLFSSKFILLIDLPCIVFIIGSQLESNNFIKLWIMIPVYLLLIIMGFQSSICQSVNSQRSLTLITWIKILIFWFCDKDLWEIYAFSVILQCTIMKEQYYLNIASLLLVAVLLAIQSYITQINGLASLEIIQIIICCQLAYVKYNKKQPEIILQSLEVNQKNYTDVQQLQDQMYYFPINRIWLNHEEIIIVDQHLNLIYQNLDFHIYQKAQHTLCLAEFLQSVLIYKETVIPLGTKIQSMLNQKFLFKMFEQFNIHHEQFKFEGKIVQLYVRQPNQVTIHLIEDINYKEQERNFLLEICRSLSHEFGTNLNCISILTELTLQSNEISQDFKEQYLIPISTNVMQLKWFLRNLRDYSVLESNDLEPNLDTFNIKTDIHQIYCLFTAHIMQKGIKIDTQLFDYFITNDSERFRQIFYQLMQNAVRFAQSIIVISIERIFTGIQVYISNDGPGMTEVEQNRLNILLNQNTTIRVSQNSVGAGLGLLISNQLLKVLNNDNNQIKYNCSDEMTSFSFFLRDYTPEIQSSYRHSHQQGGVSIKVTGLKGQVQYFKKTSREVTLINSPIIDHTRKFSKDFISDSEEDSYNLVNVYSKLQQTHYHFKFITEQKGFSKTCCQRVLIVDDEYFNIFALEKLLSQYGFICDSAFNGQKALDKIQSKNEKLCCNNCNNNKYCIIFLDINMPVMDGLETVKHIKQMQQNRIIEEVICIANTAFTDRETYQRAFDAGMDYFITKPLNRTKLKNIISQIFPDL